MGPQIDSIVYVNWTNPTPRPKNHPIIITWLPQHHRLASKPSSYNNDHFHCGVVPAHQRSFIAIYRTPTPSLAGPNRLTNRLTGLLLRSFGVVVDSTEPPPHNYGITYPPIRRNSPTLKICFLVTISLEVSIHTVILTQSIEMT